MEDIEELSGERENIKEFGENIDDSEENETAYFFIPKETILRQVLDQNFFYYLPTAVTAKDMYLVSCLDLQSVLNTFMDSF